MQAPTPPVNMMVLVLTLLLKSIEHEFTLGTCYIMNNCNLMLSFIYYFPFY